MTFVAPLRESALLQLRQRVVVSFPSDARALISTIAWSRPCAALGQALAIVVSVRWLQVVLPLPPLVAGIAMLVLATPVAFWRLRSTGPIGEVEAVCHVAFDLAALGWALYFTGGASNPFITLLLVPVALTAAALSARATGAVVVLAGGLYAMLMFRYVPLPDMAVHGGKGFGLHLTGMAINFGIAVLLLAVFVGLMRASLNRQREGLQRLRERTLRDEGILAIATQAATAAHELNTPLATLRTLLPELGRDIDNDERRDDIHVMLGEIERCRDALRRMVDYGQRQLSGSVEATTVGVYLDANVDRFRLLHPEAEVAASVAPALRECTIQVQPGLAHALLNLMENALDASNANGSRKVTLAAARRKGEIEFTISDRGRGLPQNRLGGVPSPSSKPGGLGIGLSLVRSTVERLHGEFSVTTDASGTQVRVCLPLDPRADA